MKELVLVFRNNEEAKYYCRNLAVEFEGAFSKKKEKELLLLYTSKYNFIEKILIKLGFKDIDLKKSKILFKSKNSNLKGYRNILYINDSDIDTTFLYKIILNECRKNG